MASVEDRDSGTESQEVSQAQELSPVKKMEIDDDYEKIDQQKDDNNEIKIKEITDDDDDDEPDETLIERLWGLSEMFPESVRNATHLTYTATQASMMSLYGFSRNALWILFSTSMILFAPVIFEVERAQMEEMQRNQQKQMLLGANTAMSGSGGGSMHTLMPPLQR